MKCLDFCKNIVNECNVKLFSSPSTNLTTQLLTNEIATQAGGVKHESMNPMDLTAFSKKLMKLNTNPVGSIFFDSRLLNAHSKGLSI